MTVPVACSVKDVETGQMRSSMVRGGGHARRCGSSAARCARADRNGVSQSAAALQRPHKPQTYQIRAPDPRPTNGPRRPTDRKGSRQSVPWDGRFCHSRETRHHPTVDLAGPGRSFNETPDLLALDRVHATQLKTQVLVMPHDYTSLVFQLNDLRKALRATITQTGRTSQKLWNPQGFRALPHPAWSDQKPGWQQIVTW